MRENTAIKLQPNICQTFSIAIIILEICTFVDGESFYDMYRLKLNEVHIQRAQEIMEKLKYSKLLLNLVRIMLSECRDRPLPSQIYLSFKPYQNQIVNLQGFKFDANKIYESLNNSKASINSIYWLLISLCPSNIYSKSYYHASVNQHKELNLINKTHSEMILA